MVNEEIAKTREQAIEQLQAAGFEVTDVQRDKTTYPDLHFEIWYHGEKVGDIYESEMYLATSLPSLEQLGVFTSSNKSSIPFGVQSAIDLLLAETIERLKSIAEKYDDLVREKRITDVRKYFKERELKRQRRDELILSHERGEHLSREDLQELSVMGYTI